MEDPKINGQYSKVGLPTGVSYEEIHCLLKEGLDQKTQWPNPTILNGLIVCFVLFGLDGNYEIKDDAFC